jgi:hypothetical protein
MCLASPAILALNVPSIKTARRIVTSARLNLSTGQSSFCEQAGNGLPRQCYLAACGARVIPGALVCPSVRRTGDPHARAQTQGPGLHP